MCRCSFLSTASGSISRLRRTNTTTRVALKKKAKRLLVPDLFRGAVWAGPVYCIFYGPASTVAAFALGDSPSQLWFLLALFWMFALIELMWRIRPALLRKWQTLLAPAAASSTAGGALGAASKVLLFVLRLVGPLALLSAFGHAEQLIGKVRGSLFGRHSFGARPKYPVFRLWAGAQSRAP